MAGSILCESWAVLGAINPALRMPAVASWSTNLSATKPALRMPAFATRAAIL
ncbi:hypothetical protein M569_13679, partial [Genlisea aurea]